tara:strand:+ start:5805 stop:6419 length:615 start_codon:yes stop_codon:yes gene_type:complete
MSKLTFTSPVDVFTFEITGKSPGIMFNNPAMMGESSGGVTKTRANKKYNDEDEAEMRTYRNDKGNLVVPAVQIRASILEASKAYKLGRTNMKTLLNHIIIEPVDELELKKLNNRPIKTYNIDKRRVVVSRAGIMRARPVVPEWKLSFSVEVDRELMENSLQGTSTLDVLTKILSDAGKKQGIGDYRPQKGGSFGRFDITNAKEE